MVVVGIDLGTTNSAVAIFQDGIPQVIQDETGKRLIPSVVTFAKEEILTGARAKQVAHQYPGNSIYDAKRFIGQKFHDANVQVDMTNVSYKIVNENGYPFVSVTSTNKNPADKKKTISIEEVTAHLLKHIKSVAENHLRKPVTQAVICVPAQFDDARRKATRNAAEIAGLRTVHIINEPTAAAIASQYKRKKLHTRNILVYDFGVGTFDVSIVSVHEHRFYVIATDGDCYLGGKDIDKNITELIKKIFNLRVLDDRKSRRLRTVCEDAKKKLSFSKEHSIDLESLSAENYSMTRQKFEEINEGLFQKTIALINKALNTAKLTADDINEVVMVGGSSRIPRVRDLLKTKFPNSEMNTSINPDEAIALGAALYGGYINGDKVELKIQDVLTRSLGIGTYGDLMKIVIERNTKLPYSKEISIVTMENFQTAVPIDIYQGESLIITKNNLLGQFTINNLRKERNGAVKILIKMSVNEEGSLIVSAREAGTDNSKELDIVITDGIALSSQTHQIDHGTQEKELRYVQFIRKRNEFLVYCEDVKFDYRDKLENRPNILKEIEEYIETGESLQEEEEPDIEELTREMKSLEQHLQNV